MNKQDLLSHLCWYDQRNPNNTGDGYENIYQDGVVCSCDPCHTGRHKLANFALKQMEFIEKHGLKMEDTIQGGDSDGQ